KTRTLVESITLTPIKAPSKPFYPKFTLISPDREETSTDTNRATIQTTGREDFPHGPVVQRSRICFPNRRLVSTRLLDSINLIEGHLFFFGLFPLGDLHDPFFLVFFLHEDAGDPVVSPFNVFDRISLRETVRIRSDALRNSPDGV